MSKEIIKDGTLFKQRTTPDDKFTLDLIQEGYDAGLLAGYTKSIVLIRHLQRTLSPHTDTGSQRKILEEAMELIADKIEVNPIVGVDENDNDIYLSDK